MSVLQIPAICFTWNKKSRGKKMCFVAMYVCMYSY